MKPNLELNYEGFEDYLLEHYRDDVFNKPGIAYLFGFENGYGASVIKHAGSYGYKYDLWELAIVKLDEKGPFGYEFDLVDGAPVRHDVGVYLTDDDVRGILKEIKEL